MKRGIPFFLKKALNSIIGQTTPGIEIMWSKTASFIFLLKEFTVS